MPLPEDKLPFKILVSCLILLDGCFSNLSSVELKSLIVTSDTYQGIALAWNVTWDLGNLFVMYPAKHMSVSSSSPVLSNTISKKTM